MSSRRALPWTTKAGYGSAELGLVAVEVLVQVYLLKFYNVVVGLPSALAGLALSVAILWDAITDPVMGGVSDRTRTPWGKRRPYFIPGALGACVFFVALFHPPVFRSDGFAFVYLLIGFMSLNTSLTVISVPHVSLAGEMAFDRDQRTALFGFRRLFATLGLVVGTVLPALVLRSLGGEETADNIARSRSLTALLLCAPILLTALWAFVATRGRDESTHESGAKFGDIVRDLGRLFVSQKDVWTNKVFFPLLLSAIIAGAARTLNGSIALYYYQFRIQLHEDVIVLAVLLPFFLSLLASIPLWVWISRRVGKKWPAFWGVLGLALLTMFTYPFFPPGSVVGPICIAIVGGFCAGSVVIIDSLIADAVDYDEFRTGRDREGLYFGVWKLGTKMARALGLAFAGVFLQLIGFDEGRMTQDPEVGWRLALLFGPAVGVFFALAAIVFACFPLTDKTHRRIQRILERRRQRAGHTEPTPR
ncbi:MAG: MFS transporter [Candidatus Eisenbacteria bacterium]